MGLWAFPVGKIKEKGSEYEVSQEIRLKIV
jgi:hypothetical protein